MPWTATSAEQAKLECGDRVQPSLAAQLEPPCHSSTYHPHTSQNAVNLNFCSPDEISFRYSTEEFAAMLLKLS
ncbi:predicted protein [Plenodomus lingam JN3]|uniref:Predicted protein n=1 Tax=Leptosphaeria maculans (strain JN3 / isolate v23.1.3 / race Av1-4-5-6-7-8) TaxID=985895 RepID=E4ZRD7_LEPMJ|nr:predicted protein [Plenodomus lingam JN3]CBX93802.1 predicted protein [Plenodomus lingam JN3]